MNMENIKRLQAEFDKKVDVVRSLYPNCGEPWLHELTRELIINNDCKNCNGDCKHRVGKYTTIFDILFDKVTGECFIKYTPCKHSSLYKKRPEYSDDELKYIERMYER